MAGLIVAFPSVCFFGGTLELTVSRCPDVQSPERIRAVNFRHDVRNVPAADHPASPRMVDEVAARFGTSRIAYLQQFVIKDGRWCEILRPMRDRHILDHVRTALYDASPVVGSFMEELGDRRVETAIGLHLPAAGIPGYREAHGDQSPDLEHRTEGIGQDGLKTQESVVILCGCVARECETCGREAAATDLVEDLSQGLSTHCCSSCNHRTSS